MSKIKGFDNAIQDMTLLYELSLSIGQSLNPIKNCDSFLRRLIEIKHLSYAAVWIKDNYQVLEADKKFATLIYSCPGFYSTISRLPTKHEIFSVLDKNTIIQISSKDELFPKISDTIKVSEGTVLLLSLGNYGVLQFFSASDEQFLTNIEIRQLNNLIAKFAISLEGCLSHQRILDEINERRKAERKLYQVQNELEQKVFEKTEELRKLNESLKEEIVERKQYEKELKHLVHHDKLTGLYNRVYFEEELNRLNKSKQFPVSIIAADLDGLKLINNSLGPEVGDKLLISCAKVLKQSIKDSDTLARMDGDEFAIIMTNTNENECQEMVNRIHKKLQNYNSKHAKLPISLSIGSSTSESKKRSLKETYKNANEFMNRSKLHKCSSSKSQIIDALMTTLGERDCTTEGHGRRIADLSAKIGELMGLHSSRIDNLRLLAQVHDLGKVGIPDKILLKKGPLTEEEWVIMRQHPVKGYRIALSSPDLSSVANFILLHHERWDGTGYPTGASGKDIPVECRILSIIDSYDAMTNDRPYCKARSSDEALAEIRQMAGKKYDPQIVEIFEKYAEGFLK